MAIEFFRNISSLPRVNFCKRRKNSFLSPQQFASCEKGKRKKETRGDTATYLIFNADRFTSKYRRRCCEEARRALDIKQVER